MGTYTPVRTLWAFQIHDRVIAQLNAQGLEAGAAYKVVGVVTIPTPAGDYVTYTIEALEGPWVGEAGPDPIRQQHEITNGHILLRQETLREEARREAKR